MGKPDVGELNALLAAHGFRFQKTKTPGFLSRGFVEGEGASRSLGYETAPDQTGNSYQTSSKKTQRTGLGNGRRSAGRIA